ncbi:hypothetical protein [Colwellia sp. E2M01]|uniref:hypothetical protein n=1 Tax=Colwellia sp. E2M01 TaxID=2841561 RepID=UPI001C08F2D0|nr:hypothetical protein [Colwellia sp. E2M01]MBU2871918.1 hypothetical protein [Colwellia sp. E2M01]
MNQKVFGFKLSSFLITLYIIVALLSFHRGYKAWADDGKLFSNSFNKYTAVMNLVSDFLSPIFGIYASSIVCFIVGIIMFGIALAVYNRRTAI